jgi:hypothetical protein
MARLIRLVGVSVVVALVCPLALWAQYPSELVGFNGPPIDDPATSQEMFQIPQFSGSTSEFVVANVSGYDNNAAFRAAGLQTEGVAALEVFFDWVDTSDPYAWVRLTTYNGPERPNPCLDTRGKVRFKITNRSEYSQGVIGICLGIRETGAEGVAQMGDGGTAGPIEWVGVTGVIPDPNDPNVAAAPIPAITLAPSPVAYALEWNLSTGVVSINGTPHGGGIAGFTGNGTLADAPNHRGTLEHIAITNLTSDAAVLIDVGIDELQFEATVPDPTPPPTIRAPVVETDTEVVVDCISEATEAELFLNEVSQGTETPIAGVATFTGLVLSVGDLLTATQTANGITSDLSAPVVVYAEGTALAENFDGYASQAQLEALWTQDDPANERKILLTSGSASSCHNFVVSDYLPGPSVSRLYFFLGSVNGTDAEPLLVTYRFKHDTNNTNARARFELAPSLNRAPGALGFAFSNGVGGAWGEQYTSMTLKTLAIDDDTINGYAEDYFGYDYALTGIERDPGVWHKMQIQVKSNVVNFYIDDQLANPIDPDTGVPLWPTGVPRVNTSDFQYIIIGVGYSNNGPAMMYDDISVTFGDTPPPFGDPNPVESPTVVGPLFPGDTSVEVSDIDTSATGVAVYDDGDLAGSVSGPFPEGTATVPVSALSNGETVTATQTVDAIESCFSAPEIVAVPAPTMEPVLVPGQTLVQVSDIEENLASAVRVYRDLGGGDLQLIGTLLNPTSDPAGVTTPPLTLGDTIVATQTIGGVEGPLSAGVEVAVPAPTVLGPLDVGDTLVTVTDVHPAAELVTVYVNVNTYSVDPAGETTVYVTVPPLQQNSAVRATQTIDGVEGPFSNTVLVANFVVINEFNYDDSGTDNFAFVELYNSGDEPIDLTDWVIQVGDYIEGQDPPGVYYQVFIPVGTTIAAHGYWTVGMSDVTYLEGAVVDLVDDSLRLDDGQNYLALRSPEGILLDAVGWETNKGYTFIPEEIYTQIGLGIWGNHVNQDIPLTAQSRFLDGLDTDQNGRDWGIQPATPGYTNNQPDRMPYFENADGLNPLDPVPGWVFSYKPLVAFDPTDTDPNGPSGYPINPYAIPYSPDGGLALIGWDEEAGGNAVYLGQLAKEDFTLETYIYVAEELTPAGYEETKVGVRGSADGVHNFDYYSGATGLCWLLQRGTTWQTLYLLDENDGDDGAPGEAICATVLGTINIGTDSALTGWQRLLLETRGDTVLGIFGGTYGSRTDGIQFTGTHESFGPGGIYISYREALQGYHHTDARPPSLDAYSLTEPTTQIPGDVDGDGDVDLTDLASLLAAYGSSTGDPNYNPNADFDNDGDVDLLDLATLLSWYGYGT